jgi:alkylation response protein AidB-like acyl-CoA dehydrogenase
MPVYQAPLENLKFVLHDVLGTEDVRSLPGHEDVTPDLIDSILEEAAKMCEEVLFPLNQSGDKEGCVWENGKVRTPKGFKEAYDAFSQAGWCGAASDPKYGGMGLPATVSFAIQEMICSANMSFDRGRV